MRFSRRQAVVIPVAVRRGIVRHARAAHPRECCGFLLGSGSTVAHAIAAANVAATPRTRFRIDDRAHLDMRRVLRETVPPLRIVGIYHSHPEGPAQPSATDVAEAHYPEWLYLIVGMRRGRTTLRAFQITTSRVVSVPIAAKPGRRRGVR